MVEEVPTRGSILGKCMPARYILAVLGSIGMAIVYGLKVCLSVTMVAMLNHTEIALQTQQNTFNESVSITTNLSTSLTSTNSVNEDEICSPPGGNATVVIEDGPFGWIEPLPATLLSCYFWGYLISQIPGARIAEIYSAKWVMFFSVAINVICTLLTPFLTNLHYSGLIVMRVLEGIGGGATFPAMHCLIAAWAPPNERSLMSSIIYVGTSFGTAISILGAGILSNAYGWESVFYIMGGISCLWLLPWLFLVQDNPNKQSLISAEERLMITSQLGTNSTDGDASPSKDERQSVPWKKIATSIPFWAILIAHFCNNFGWYMFLIDIPFYMKQVLQFNISSNALASAMPFFPMLIFSILFGKSLDTLKTKQKISKTTATKLATSVTSLIPAICLLCLCYIGCQHTAAVVIVGIAIVAMGGMFSGFLSNHIDIAPNYAGTLVAITNTAATLPGIIVPLFIGFITKGNQTIGAWRIIFFVTIAVLLIEFIVFVLFASGEEQPWNKNSSLKTDPETAEQDESTPLKNTTTTPASPK